MAVEELKKVGLAIPILFSIILLTVISVIVVVSFQEVKPVTESIAIVNESNTFSGSSVILGADSPLGNFLSIDNSSVTLYNNTNVTIGSNNYYPFPNGSVILAGGADIGATALVNATYNYNIEATSYYYNITKGGGDSFQNITKQLPLFGTIIILILIASLALGIFAFIGGRKKPL